ncbi:MAG: ATP-binding protein [Oscillatoria sp. SIO1A7]|nr:ATP-binding protein [Oscillatoria sp. SIO1A7]
MLVEFSVENYRSIQERQTLSMVASEDLEVGAFRETPLLENNSFPMPTDEELRLLASAAIYGPNASGKSNLVRAMQSLKRVVMDSATKMQAGERLPYIQPFLLDAEWSKKPTCFEIIFIDEEIRYEYQVSLDQRRVYEEQLIARVKGRSQTWFSRQYDPEDPELQQDDGYEWSFPKLKGEKKRIQKFVRSNSLFLSHAAQNNHPQLTKVFKWFVKKMNFIDPDFSKSYTTGRCMSDTEFREAVVKLIVEADIGISDINFVPKPMPAEMRDFFLNRLKEVSSEIQRTDIIEDFDEGEFEVVQVVTVHKPSNSEEPVSFNMNDESEGTQRFFEMAGPWLDVLQEGEVLIVDELDRSMHPVLARSLVKMFNDPEINKKNAQLIFTTHDTTLLDAEIFHRGQVWFTEKDRNMTNLYSLLEFQPRKDESLQRGYLLGRYGAIPFIGGLNI